MRRVTRVFPTVVFPLPSTPSRAMYLLTFDTVTIGWDTTEEIDIRV
jgi:hypothetical protein